MGRGRFRSCGHGFGTLTVGPKPLPQFRRLSPFRGPTVFSTCRPRQGLPTLLSLPSLGATRLFSLFVCRLTVKGCLGPSK